MTAMNQNAYYDPTFDAMPGRGLKARWVLEGALSLATAAHFGGKGDSALDMPILRCARTGRPLLPGTSLGGALRAYALDRLAGYGNEPGPFALDQTNWQTLDKTKIAVLFGGARGDDKGSQSPLIVFDALGTLPKESSHTEVRDGVMIESATGTAADHKKFDFELLPFGTTFDVRFDLLVADGANEGDTLSLLCATVEGLSTGQILIGMRRSRGLGKLCCTNWKARRFDLSTNAGWLEWIGSDHEHPTNCVIDTMPCPSRAVEQAGKAKVIVDSTDKRKRIIIEADAKIVGDLLIRSPNTQADGPDVMHLSSGGKPVVTGTSLTGVIRAHALRVTQLVRKVGRKEAEEKWIDPLFGPREEGTRNPDFKPKGSRLLVSECSVNQGKPQRVTRVAIDRFTQGVVPTALFDEQPHVGGMVTLRFEVRNPQEGEAGLLLLVLKDLLTGQLPIGGTSSVGRGVLIGQKLMVSGYGISSPIELVFNEAGTRNGRVPTSDELNNLVEVFVKAATAVRPEGASR